VTVSSSAVVWVAGRLDCIPEKARFTLPPSMLLPRLSTSPISGC